MSALCGRSGLPNVRVREKANDVSWLDSDRCRIAVPRQLCLNFGLFRHLKRIVDFNAKGPHCAFKFGMPKEQLNSARVLDATINQ
jgi:hypothetical protein